MIAFALPAVVLYPFTLSPAIAALSMSGGSAVVVNPLLLKRTKLAEKKSAKTKVLAVPAPAAAGVSV